MLQGDLTIGKDEQLPLHHFQHFSSQNFDALKYELCRALTPHKLRLLRSTRYINAHINSVELDQIKIQTMAVGPAVEVLPLNLEDFYIIHMPFREQVLLRVGKEEFRAEAGQAVILSPGSRIGAVWTENSCALLMTIPRNYLHLHFENLYGFSPNQPLTFEPTLNLNGAAGLVWQRLWTYILSEIEERHEGLPVGRWISNVNSLIIETLFENVSHNYSEITSAKFRSNEPPWIMEAEAYMHLKSADRPSLGEIASYVGVSPRNLARQFLHYRGCSPIRRFQNICLESVRRDLKDGRGSVTEIALDWGFNELGRFSKSYTERFGEKPSETLRKNMKRRGQPIMISDTHY